MSKHNDRREALRAESVRAYHAGAPIGDVSILKFAALGEPRPAGIDERLRHLCGYAPIVERETLRALPEGTFGRAYLNFLEDNGIQHMTYSTAMLERFRDDPYALRTGMTHDLHHMLLGADAGIAGEVAVAAFQAAQGSLGETRLALRSVLSLALGYTKDRPAALFRVWGNLINGWRLGRRTPLLIAQRLEDMFALPLADVRQQVGLPQEPRKAGIRYTDEVDGRPVAIAVDSATARPGRDQQPGGTSQ